MPLTMDHIYVIAMERNVLIIREEAIKTLPLISEVMPTS
jgi:hypothetical protein